MEVPEVPNPGLYLGPNDPLFPLGSVPPLSRSLLPSTEQHLFQSERAKKLVNSILSLEIFKHFTNNLNVRNLKAITNSIDGNLQRYQDTWASLIEFEAFSKLTSPFILNSVLSPENKHSKFSQS